KTISIFANEYLSENPNAVIPSITTKDKSSQSEIFPINAQTELIQDKLLRLGSGIPKAFTNDQNKFNIEIYDIKNKTFKFIGYIILKIEKKEFLK
ncbi:3297_t:CDS:2, partial [Racocetra persica]